jgi:hypothetical protein
MHAWARTHAPRNPIWAVAETECGPDALALAASCTVHCGARRTRYAACWAAHDAAGLMRHIVCHGASAARAMHEPPSSAPGASHAGPHIRGLPFLAPRITASVSAQAAWRAVDGGWRLHAASRPARLWHVAHGTVAAAMPAPTRRACDADAPLGCTDCTSHAGAWSGRPRRGCAGRPGGTCPGVPAAVGIGADRSTAMTTTPSEYRCSGYLWTTRRSGSPSKTAARRNEAKSELNHHKTTPPMVCANLGINSKEARAHTACAAHAVQLAILRASAHPKLSAYAARVETKHMCSKAAYSGVSVRTLPRTWPQRRAMSQPTMQSMRQVRPPKHYALRMP